MARGEWLRLPARFPGLELGAYQVMPDHIHGILLLSAPEAPGKVCNVGAQRPNQPHVPGTPTLRPGNQPTHSMPHRSFHDNVAPGSVGAIVRAYKSAVALRYNRMRLPDHGPLWQRNYYVRIIRDSGEMEGISRYILENPFQWGLYRRGPDFGDE